MDTSAIRFDDRGLLPAIAQDASSGEVLMLAYMNREALEKTLETRRAHYYSRSRAKLWLKGETSGHFQTVRAVYYDCDMDAILLKVEQAGVACHTGQRTCFFERLDPAAPGGQAAPGPDVISSLYDVIEERKKADPSTSYVARLLAGGRRAVLKKVAEESAELVDASLNSRGAGNVVHETADLWFHTLVLLAKEGIPADDIFAELDRRFGVSGLDEKRSRAGGGKG